LPGIFYPRCTQAHDITRPEAKKIASFTARITSSCNRANFFGPDSHESCLKFTEDNMTTAAGTLALDLSHVSEVLEVATSILQRHRDEHLSKKTLILQGFLDMSQRYPERDYRASIDRALVELTGAIHLHLNAELHNCDYAVCEIG
jgi:hypothetical protein